MVMQCGRRQWKRGITSHCCILFFINQISQLINTHLMLFIFSLLTVKSAGSCWDEQKMRVSSSRGMCFKQAIPVAARHRRWKRRTMLVLTDVSGAKQLSVLTRRCCLLAPCRRRRKRPRNRSAKDARKWERTEEKCEHDENLRSIANEQCEKEKEESKTEPPLQSLEGNVNGSLKKSRSLTEQANGSEATEQGTEQRCLNGGSFTVNGMANGQSFDSFIDNGTVTSGVSERLFFTAVNVGNERSIVLMPPSQRLTFRGKCQMTCLYGSVQVLGFTIGPGQPAYHLYSLPSHTALSIQALPHGKPGQTKREMKIEVKAVLRQHVAAASRHDLMKEVTASCSVLLLERLDTPETLFLSSFPEYKEIFALHSKRMISGKHAFSECAPLTSIGVVVLPDDQGMHMSESWTATVQEIVKTCLDDNGCPVILTCGGKNVGKSTFNRHLMNSLLNHIPCVEFLELDIGQTEFSPPGCMALHLVTNPIFSPPYMHQCEPHKMVYYGNVLCDRDPDRYMEAVKYLYAEYKKGAPLIINTMGWIKGFGLSVLVDLIRLLAPTHVVQLVTTRGSRDSVTLTPEFVQTASGWHTKRKHQIQQKLVDLRMSSNSLSSDEEVQMHVGVQGHKLMCIHSEFPGLENGTCLKSHSNVLRDLALLGSLSQLQPLDTCQPLSLHSMLPYQVPFNAVALHVLHCDVTPTHILYASNASLVGLCRIPGDVISNADGPVLLSQSPICDCFGVGIIRGINLEKRLYYILTPVPVAKLKQVNCLLVGAVSIPHCVFKNQTGVTGEVPYLTADYSFTLSGAGKIKICIPLRRNEYSKAVS
ncbi:polynucleotide 5'-hydroxyl-kinase NOL9-like isoform X3 [Narcine bancroftii]|uniref:polynucleotide 5'-hydroxyl-kinase NOL9-like isoform X3 n=1 Tax=Narcine bancroftii TaxID=1343680 RepID=UPI003831EBFF